MSTNGRAILIRIAGPLALGVGLLVWALSVRGSTAFYTPAPMRWSGGKRLMVKRLVEKIPPHRVYVEPFVGAGHVFWAKDPAEKEVINDIDKNLIAYYRYLRDSPRFGCDLTPDMGKWERLRRRYDNGRGHLDPCEWIYVMKYGYGAKSGQVSPNPSQIEDCKKNSNPRTCNVGKLVANFPNYSGRLKKTVIRSEDWEKVVREFDGRDTFIYLDPPYTNWVESPSKCGYVSCAVTPERLAEVLRKVKAKWLVTYDDHPRVKKAFRGFKVRRMDTSYNLQKAETGNVKPVVNLVISNY